MSLFPGWDRRASARAVSVVGAIGVSLAVAAASSGSAAAVHAKPARSAHSTPTATKAYELGAGDSGAYPLIAYEGGYTYVAWDAPGAGNPGIDLCIIAPSTTSCEGGEAVLLTDTAAFNGNNIDDQPTLSNLDVLANGDVVVTGSSAAGSANSVATTEAWESPAGGAAFLTSGQGLTNGGGNITPVYTYYTENDAAPLTGNDLAIADAYGGYFSDSPVSGGETPSSIAHPNLDTGTNGNYPRHSLEVSGDELAAEPDPAAGAGKYVVVTAGDDFVGTAPSSCPAPSLATGYGVAVGTVGGTGAGSLNAQTTQKTYSLLQCQAESPALAGGGSAGIGVLEEEGAEAAYPSSSNSLSVVWRPFVPTATGGSFGSAVTLQDISTVNLAGGEDFDAAEDTAGGVYASWVDEQGLVLDYSSKGGVTWDGPIAQNSPGPGATQNTPTIAAVAGGIGEVAYQYNGQIWVQAVDFMPPAPTTLTTTQIAGTTTGANLTVNERTVGETDLATITGANASVESLNFLTPQGAFAGGTVTYRLYSNSACSSKGKVYQEGTVNVAGGDVPASDAVAAALKPGTYYWQASFSGNLANQPSTSACGSEKLTVAPVQVAPSAPASPSGVTLTITCASACTVNVTIDSGVVSVARAGDKRTSSRKLGTGSLKLGKAGKGKLHVSLTSYGQKLLKKDHDKLTTTLLLKVRADRKSYSTRSKLKLHK